MYEQTLADVLLASFRNSAKSFLLYLPVVLGSIVIFLIGWVMAGVIGRAVERLADYFGLDVWLERLGFGKSLARAGFQLRGAYALGMAIRWGLILVLLSAVAETLRLPAIAVFLQSIVRYLPRLVVAVVIMLTGALIADFLERVVEAGAKAARTKSSRFLKILTRWTVWIFTMFAALEQLGVTADLIQTLITGFVAMLAIAGGVAFGLGGREHATELIGKIRRDLTHE